MIDPLPTQPASEPLGTPQRLAGIELQLVRLNAQLRTVTRWIQIRETIGLVTRLIAIGAAVFAAYAVMNALRELQTRLPFGGTGTESFQDRLKNFQGFELPDLTR